MKHEFGNGNLVRCARCNAGTNEAAFTDCPGVCGEPIPEGPPGCDTCGDTRTVGDPAGPTHGIYDVVDCPDCPDACPGCGGLGEVLGTLGQLTHYRCQACGLDYHEEVS